MDSGRSRPLNLAAFHPTIGIRWEAFRSAVSARGLLHFENAVCDTAMTTNRSSHIRLTSHPGAGTPSRFPIRWGAATARERGPVIGTVTAGSDRNAVGAHGGAYALYRALAVSAGALNPIARPDLTNTAPVIDIGPHPQWSEQGGIVSLDPWGHRVHADFRAEIAEGLDIRPTIAVTRARLTIAELDEAVARGRLKVDGEIIRKSGDIAVTKAAIDP